LKNLFSRSALQTTAAGEIAGFPEDTTGQFMTRSVVYVLQIGVLLSAFFILLGLSLQPFRPGQFSVERLISFPETLGQVWTGLWGYFDPQAVITSGLLFLIATPILRVGVSLISFILEKDRRYIWISSLVLAILLISLCMASQGQQNASVNELNQLHFSFLIMFLIFISSILAGVLGSLVGLGGGVLIVPLLTLVFRLPIQYAIGASIISVIATSSGAAVAYVKDRVTNMRLGMFLELGTTTGAITGAFLAGLLAPMVLSIVFGVILLASSLPMAFKLHEEVPSDLGNDRLANWLGLSGSYPDRYLGQEVTYHVTRTPLGLAMMYIAGVISGLLGIGSGEFKVLALDTVMRLPMKVSSTTSNFMIGVTAAASAGIYFSRGDIPPLLAGPVALGILIGALVGARLMMVLSNKMLRWIFLPVIVIAALEMVLHGFGIG